MKDIQVASIRQIEVCLMTVYRDDSPVGVAADTFLNGRFRDTDDGFLASVTTRLVSETLTVSFYNYDTCLRESGTRYFTRLNKAKSIQLLRA